MSLNLNLDEQVDDVNGNAKSAADVKSSIEKRLEAEQTVHTIPGSKINIAVLEPIGVP